MVPTVPDAPEKSLEDQRRKIAQIVASGKDEWLEELLGNIVTARGFTPQQGAGRQPPPGPAGGLDGSQDADDPLNTPNILSPSGDFPFPVSPSPSSHALLEPTAVQPKDAPSGKAKNTAVKVKGKGNGKKGKGKGNGKGKAPRTRHLPVDEHRASPTPSTRQRRARRPADK